VDGLTEDLITDLSRTDGLFVIAGNSVFAYKGKATDVREIARSLGVRYVLEGSARRSAGRVRINVQLLDALDGAHLWAERFDRDLKDIFEVQDEVTGRIAGALVGKLIKQTASRSRTTSLEAYDLCVRGRALTESSAGSLEAVREARELFRQALDLDENYAEAHRWYAFNLWSGWTHDAGEPREPNAAESVRHAIRAVNLDGNDANNHWVLGHVLAYELRWKEADRAFEAALGIDSNNADALAIMGEHLVHRGEPDTAIEQVQRALRLNPLPPSWYYWELGLALYAARKYAEAVPVLRNLATYRTASRRILAACLAQMGKLDEAAREAKLLSSLLKVSFALP
jgi:TolB-like protein/cytochrome c-type biogenesis protein CcmH/NrfG